MESKIDDVSNEALYDAALELDAIADHVSWTDEDYADELRTIVHHLQEKMDS